MAGIPSLADAEDLVRDLRARREAEEITAEARRHIAELERIEAARQFEKRRAAYLAERREEQAENGRKALRKVFGPELAAQIDPLTIYQPLPVSRRGGKGWVVCSVERVEQVQRDLSQLGLFTSSIKPPSEEGARLAVRIRAGDLVAVDPSRDDLLALAAEAEKERAADREQEAAVASARQEEQRRDEEVRTYGVALD